ncbi:hypothetical protein B0H15DRAFT_841436 [Mycena belliarum]|uniref:DUF6534 domain-containing protein n=1 Tax=Mycena belliarum TaxID=1033014 RepID=A0AAD6U800_9AGAR|nr:hypothetical protein B0H15DRAFT_841436 [Mycena belliae]
MAGQLDKTFGVWAVTILFSAILLGMGLLQVYLYFVWYTQDKWGIKATVLTITALEIAQSGLFFSAMYTIIIDHFGDFDQLNIIPWQATTQLLLIYLTTFVAQSYFSYVIYLLEKKRFWFPLGIVILSFIALGAGVAQTILSFRIKFFSDLPSTSAATNTQAALALTCDILVTVGLCWQLSISRTAVQSTNAVVNFIIVTAINRGVLTMVTAALNMILFLTKPGTFYFMFVLILSGKFYMNSMLAMLNTRKHAHTLYELHQVVPVSMGSFVAPNNHGVNIIVTHETTSDRDASKASL